MKELLITDFKHKQHAKRERWHPQNILEKARDLDRAPSLMALETR
jgi:hypothetical protein